MKLLYCIASIYNPGGMERVMLNKIRWFIRQGGYDITVVTTDQQGRPPFYAFPPEVRMIDLGINYSVDNSRSPIAKITSYFQKRCRHRKSLRKLLMQERPDITISLYPSESSFIPSLKDGSKKVLELHYCKYFRLQYGRKGLLGLADRFRTWQDERIVRRFDRFVVLTNEDAGYWGTLPNLEVIPNAALQIPEVKHNPSSKRVIAVGRLDYQKSFDRLLDAWALVPENRRKGWRLDIFGQGPWEQMLQEQIVRLNLTDSAAINQPTDRIFEEYAAGSFLAMSSRYEGFPMVMVEAMSCGLPVVTFDYKCGPRDIIRDGWNGRIVPEGDIHALSQAIEEVIVDNQRRESMSHNAREVTQTYSEEHVMQQWKACFDRLLT